MGRSSVFAECHGSPRLSVGRFTAAPVSDAPPAEAGTPNQGRRAPRPPLGVPASAGGAGESEFPADRGYVRPHGPLPQEWENGRQPGVHGTISVVRMSSGLWREFPEMKNFAL